MGSCAIGSASAHHQGHLADALVLAAHRNPVALAQHPGRGDGFAVEQGFVGRAWQRRQHPLPAAVAFQHALAGIPEFAVGSELAQQRLAQLGAHADLHQPAVGGHQFEPFGYDIQAGWALADAPAAAAGLPATGEAGAATAGRGGSALAPRPVSRSRSSAAVGLAAGPGDRQRCRAALTSALLAGAGIVPSSAGNLAAWACTSRAYSPWSSRQ